MLFYLFINYLNFGIAAEKQDSNLNVKDIIDDIKCLYVFLKKNHDKHAEIFQSLNMYYSECHFMLFEQNIIPDAVMYDDVFAITNRFEKAEWIDFNQKIESKYSFRIKNHKQLNKLYNLAISNTRELKRNLKNCGLWQNESKLEKFLGNLFNKFFKYNNNSNNNLPKYFDRNYKTFINDRIEYIIKNRVFKRNWKVGHNKVNPFLFISNENYDYFKKTFILLYFGLIKKLERYVFFVLEICYLEEKNHCTTYDHIKFKYFLELLKNYKKTTDTLKGLDEINNEQFFQLYFKSLSLRNIIDHFTSLTSEFVALINENKQLILAVTSDAFDIKFINLIEKIGFNQSIIKKILPNDLILMDIFTKVDFVQFEDWYKNFDLQNGVRTFKNNFLIKHEVLIKQYQKIHMETDFNILNFEQKKDYPFKLIIYDFYSKTIEIKEKIIQNLLEVNFEPLIYGFHSYKLLFVQLMKLLAPIRLEINNLSIEMAEKIFKSLNKDNITNAKDIKALTNELILKFSHCYEKLELNLKSKSEIIDIELNKHISKKYIFTLLYEPLDYYLPYNYSWFKKYSLNVNYNPHPLYCLYLFKLSLTSKTAKKKLKFKKINFDFSENYSQQSKVFE